MSEHKTLQLDEVQAAIDLEVSVLKTAIEMVVTSLAEMSNHMNTHFRSMSEAIRETQEKHNGLGKLVIDFIGAMEKALGELDCLR